jgi:uncharacterized coiled-coil protein SlyX
MLDTTPDQSRLALVQELTEARSEQRWLVRRLALAATQTDRARIRLELEILVGRIAKLAEQHAASPAWERR